MKLKDVDFTNKVIENGRVTILHRDPNNHRYWICKCYCGAEFREFGNVLDRKGRKGCSPECSQQKHGQSGIRSTREYRAWKGMRQRCDNPNYGSYRHYGGRGIKYDLSWRSYATFFKDMGECPPGMTLERKHVHRGYTKDNCKWATIEEQNSNKQTTRYLVLNGRIQTMIAWARELNIKYATLSNRYHKGWCDELILTYTKGMPTPQNIAPRRHFTKGQETPALSLTGEP